MNVVEVGAAERRRGMLSAALLASAAEAVRTDGYVFLIDAVDLAPLRSLRCAIDAAAERAIASVPAAARLRRLQMEPPTDPDLVFREILANAMIGAVTTAVLGRGAFSNLYSCNVNCPGSAAQPVHVDVPQLWPGLAHAHPAASLTIEIPLVETSDENGSTELWPRTHCDTRFELIVAADALGEMRRTRPPVRANVPLGSVIVRDPRLWHRGMENRSTSIRSVVSMAHNVFWLERGPPMRFSAGCEPAFEGAEVLSNVRFDVNDKASVANAS